MVKGLRFIKILPREPLLKGRRVFRLFARVDGAREKRAGFLASYPFRSEERKKEAFYPLAARGQVAAEKSSF